MDIIGEWAPMNVARKLPAGIAILDLEGEQWAGFFTWENIAGWRWRMKTSKSKYRSAADFDLTKYTLLLPLLEAVVHTERSGAVVKGSFGLPVRADMYRRWFRQIARASGIPDEVWNMDSRAGGATEADEAGAAVDAIQGALTHTKESTTLRYLRRGRSKKISQVAEARSSKRAADTDGGTS
jgi:integrase